ncbi:MAG: hypothetical protein KDK48_01135 [Chlamydiia bacterium]|nr:hypothetical protein [Chlamydiia bacterium]
MNISPASGASTDSPSTDQQQEGHIEGRIVRWDPLQFFQQWAQNLGPVGSFFWRTLSVATSIYDGVGSAYQFFCDMVIDGNHPAKQLKYRFMLAEIALVPEGWIQRLMEGVKESNPFTRSVHEALKLIIHPDHEIASNYRERHHRFILALREALQTDEYTFEKSQRARGQKYCWELEVIDMLISNLYQAQLYTFTENLLTWAITKGQQIRVPGAEVDLGTLSVSEMHEAVKSLPQQDLAPLYSIWYHSLVGTFALGFDPMLEGNPPYALFDVFVADKPIRIIRTAAPVYSRKVEGQYQSKVFMTPEYQAFIDWIAREGKTMIYCSLQSLTDGSEARYNAAISEGFTAAGLNESFCALDQDFVDAAKAPSNSEGFKLYLLSTLYNDQHFQLPKSWKENRTFLGLLREALDQISDVIFERKPELDEEERRDFIDIFYSYFVFCQIGFFRPDYFTICCRDAADRHGKVLFLLHLLITLFEGKDPKDSNFERVVLTFAPPLLGRKMPMLQSRFDRLVAAYSRMLNDGVKNFFFTSGETFPLSHTITRRDYQADGWNDQIRSS